MRKMIEGKHLGKCTTVNLKTGKETRSNTKMMMMPAKEGTCPECAVPHEESQPHNAQSMFYQYYFYNQKGRWPTWNDALSHCPDDVQSRWKSQLRLKGIKI